jgi:hypothetical protein
MPTHPVYDLLLADITEEMERAVLTMLLEHAGERVNRYELLEAVHGAEARAWAEKHGLANSKEDRQNRECIEALQRKDYPIYSSSGEAGYILAIDEKAADTYITEIGSRIKAMEAKKDALTRSKRMIPFIRQYKETRPAIQVRLF